MSYPVERPFPSPGAALAYLDHERLTCLRCGRELRALPTHLRRVHGMTADEYRALYHLPLTRGLVGTETRAIMAQREAPAAFDEWRGSPTGIYPRRPSPYKSKVDRGHGFEPDNPHGRKRRDGARDHLGRFATTDE